MIFIPKELLRQAFCFLIFYIFQPLVGSEQQTIALYKIRGMSGTHTNQILILKNKFKATTNVQDNTEIEPRHNRVLFHGTPGNGKTIYAQKLAALTKRELIECTATDIVEAYQGKGAQKIIKLIQDAESIVEKTGKGVVIFIDEIEMIASNIETESRAEQKNTLAQLWTLMDKHECNNELLFVFAANNIKKISRTFLNRFRTENIIETTIPDDNNRKEIILDFVSGTLPLLNENVLHSRIHGLITYYIKEIQSQINGINKLAQFHIMYSEKASKSLFLPEKLDLVTTTAIQAIAELPVYAPLQEMQEVYSNNLEDVITVLDDLKKQLIDLNISQNIMRKIDAIYELEKKSKDILQTMFRINNQLQTIETILDTIEQKNNTFSANDKNELNNFIATIEEDKVQLHTYLSKEAKYNRELRIILFYINNVNTFTKNIQDFLSTYDKRSTLIPLQLLTTLVDVTKGLSYRLLSNYKDKILKIIKSSNANETKSLIQRLKDEIAKDLVINQEIEDPEALKLYAIKLGLNHHFSKMHNPHAIRSEEGRAIFKEIKEEFSDDWKRYEQAMFP